MRGEPLNKWERIKLVKKLGFNTEDSINVETLEDLENNKEFIDRCSAFSIRVYDSTNKRSFTSIPHFPTVAKKSLYKRVKEILDDGLNLIIANQINPKDCLLAGTALKCVSSLFFELSTGPCTVRKVTHDGIIDHSLSLDFSNLEILKAFGAIGEAALLMAAVRFSNIIFEFSIYKKPVGICKHPFICWEITDDGTGKSGIDEVRV
jgi:hypothetical protein